MLCRINVQVVGNLFDVLLITSERGVVDVVVRSFDFILRFSFLHVASQDVVRSGLYHKFPFSTLIYDIGQTL